MLGKHSAKTLIAVAIATIVATLLSGELGLCLELFWWASANLLGLPFSVYVAGTFVSVLLAAYVAVLLFIRVYRIECRLTRGQSYEDVGWRFFLST